MPSPGGLRCVRSGVARAPRRARAVGALHRHAVDGSGKSRRAGLGPRDPHRLDRPRRCGRARPVGDPRVLRAHLRHREVRGRRVPDLAGDPSAPRPRRRTARRRGQGSLAPTDVRAGRGGERVESEDGAVLPGVPALSSWTSRRARFRSRSSSSASRSSSSGSSRTGRTPSCRLACRGRSRPAGDRGSFDDGCPA